MENSAHNANNEFRAAVTVASILVIIDLSPPPMAKYRSTSSTILPFALVRMLTSISLTGRCARLSRSLGIVDYLGGHRATSFDKLHCSYARHRRPALQRRTPHPQMAPLRITEQRSALSDRTSQFGTLW